MKSLKTILVASASVMLASFSMATVTINWNNGHPALGGVNGNDNQRIALNTYWQLIWSPDNMISAPDASNPFLPSEGEVVLMDGRTGQAPSLPVTGAFLASAQTFQGEVGFGLGADAFVGGYAYSRVFDYTGAVPASPMDVNGIFYAQGGLTGPLAKIDAVPAGTPSTVNIAGAGTATTNIQWMAIPEPSVAGLLLIGMGVIAKRFRRD